MIGTVRVVGSLLIARVAWKPLRPGMTTSMRIRSGLTVRAFRIASSPLSLATTSYPALVNMSLSTCRSVGESSPIRIRLIAFVSCPLLRGGLHVRRHGFQQALLGERLGQILVRADHAPARAIEQTILRRKHHDR